MEMFILCLCILKVCNLFSLLQGLTAKSLPWVSEKTWNSVGTV
jgi:hypothetical protein